MPIFHPVSSPILSSPSLRFMALPGLLFTAFPDGFETLRTVLRRRGAVKHREAGRFMGDALVQWSKPKWTALSIDRDLRKKFGMFLSCRTQTSVASLPLAGGLRFVLLGPIAQNWRSLTCCEPIPQAAHSLQPRLAVAKKKFGTGVHLKLAPKSTYMKHHETMVIINIILCVEIRLPPFG